MSAQLFAFLLALAAGLATMLGAVAAFATPSRRLLAASLAFAAGAMVLVSLLEILPEAAARIGLPVALAAGGVGALAVAGMQRGLRRWVPEGGQSLRRTGLLLALALALHNLPEGMAPFLSALASPGAGIAIAVAIALHNIPEGVAIAVPLRAAGASRTRAFGYTAVAGLAEAAGAGIAWMLAGSLTAGAVAVLLAGVAGMMLWLSATELMPAARNAAKGMTPIMGAATGATVMALSLVAI